MTTAQLKIKVCNVKYSRGPFLVRSLALVSVSIASSHGAAATASSAAKTSPTATSITAASSSKSSAATSSTTSESASTAGTTSGSLGFGRLAAIALVSPGKVLVATIRADPISFPFLAATASAAALVLPRVVPLGQRNLDLRTVKVLAVEPTDRRLGRVRVLVRDGGLALRTARLLVLVDPDLRLHGALVLLNDADGAKVVGDFRLGRVRVHALHEDGVLLRDHLSVTFAIITTLVAGATAEATALVTTSSTSGTTVAVTSARLAIAATIATTRLVIILRSITAARGSRTGTVTAAASSSTATQRRWLVKVGLRNRRRGNRKVHACSVATVILRRVSGVLVGHR